MSTSPFITRKNVLRQRPAPSSNKFQLPDDDDGLVAECFGKEEKPIHRIPSYGLLVLLVSLLLVAYIASVFDLRTSPGLTAKQAGLNKFSEERAWDYLRTIVGDGPRVASSPYHLEKTADLKNLLDGIASTSVQTVQTDWQMVSGDYLLELKGGSFVNSYTNASNVIAVLEGSSGFHQNGSTNTSLLLNCHYDSVPTSPGASDNAIFCAVMVEILYIMAHRSEKPLHNVVFLFNGAEENPLQGSPGFLKHKWAEGVTAVVNLDSNGMNGRPSLFQSNNMAVLNAYKGSVSSPALQSLAEMLFNSGVIPSDTDFRIFRDHGHIYGVDIAFSYYSHVYHTKYDSLHLIKLGTLQTAGEIVLPLVVTLANETKIQNKSDPEKAVYYDYLHLFMLSYTTSVSYVVDVILLCFGIVSVIYTLALVGFTRKMYMELLWCTLGVTSSFLSGAILLYFLVTLETFIMMQLRYYSNQWIIVPMMWFPFAVGSVISSQLFYYWRAEKCGLNRLKYSCLWSAANRLVCCVVVLATMTLPAACQGRYLLTVPLFYVSAVAVILITCVRLYNITALGYLLTNYMLVLPILMWVMTITILFNGTMVPTMGRSTTSYPDYMIASLNLLCMAVVAFTLVGIELLFSRTWLWVSAGVVLVAGLVFAFLPLWPYSGNYDTPAPQRYYLYHTNYRQYNVESQLIEEQSFLWVTRIDVNTPRTLADSLPARDTPAALSGWQEKLCAGKAYCGVPVNFPKYQEYVESSLFIPMEPPNEFTPAVHIVTSKQCNNDMCVINIQTYGTLQGGLILIPESGVELVNWSLESPTTPVDAWNNRPVYYIYHSEATYSGNDAKFLIDVNGTAASSSKGILSLTHITLRMYHDSEFTRQYTRILDSTPDYMQLAPYIASRHDYVL